LSTAASLATSETISDPVDDEALESVDDEVALDALETLEAELDESSAVNRLVRSVSSFDSRLLALDELSVELKRSNRWRWSRRAAVPAAGRGRPPTPPGPPVEAPLAEELWLPLLSNARLLSCDRN